MAEQKILISIQIKDDGSPELKKVEGALKGVSKETQKLNEHEKQREALQQKIIKSTSKEAVELKQLELRLQLANKRTTEAAKAAINAAEGQDVFAKSVGGTTKGLKQNRAQSGLNNAILIEMGRTASDAQYGFQGMANNIGRLVELGQEFTRTGAGGLKGALSTLGKSIMGTGGILIGVQLLISFLPTLQKKFKELRGSVFDLNDVFEKSSETVSNIIGKFEAYIGTLKDTNTSQREFDNTIRALQKDFPRLAKQFELAGIPLSEIKDSTEEATKITDDYRESIIELAMARASATAIEEQASKSIQARLDAEAKVREGVSQGWFRSNVQFKNLADAREKFEELQSKKEQERLKGTELALYTNLKNIIESVDKEQEILQERVQILSPTYEAERQQIESVSALKREGIDLTVLEGKATIETNNAVTDNLSQNVNARIELTEREKRVKIRAIKAQQQMELSYANTAKNLSNLFKALGEENKGLQIAGVVAEAAANISKIITNTQAANAIAKVMSPLTNGQPFVTLNKISAGLGIATSLVSARNAIKDIRSGSLGGGGSAGAGGGGTTIQSPDFNVVGASQTSQLAETVAAQQSKPVKAFVVGKDISTQQELDRNITNTASFG